LICGDINILEWFYSVHKFQHVKPEGEKMEQYVRYQNSA